MDFVNRERELAQLDAILQQDGPQFVVLYGRRRIGKTMLITNWINQLAGESHAYWVAHRTASDVLLRGFSEAAARLLPTQNFGRRFRRGQRPAPNGDPRRTVTRAERFC